MRRLIMSFFTVLLLLANAPARADGLLYQLPADGSWVLFDAKVKLTRGEQTQDATGSLRMSSVGSATEEGIKCRWIEFHFSLQVGGNLKVIIAKVLVPEAHLKEGQKSIENRVRGWIRLGANADVVELTAKDLGPLPAFMAGPLQEVKRLDAAIVESKLGRLACAGVDGRSEFTDNANHNKVTYQIRRHDDAPFGVVSCNMTINVERGGKVADSVTLDLTVSDFGMAAKSELPGHN